jgi:hypothetical protein
MPLISCPDCGRSISDQAATCLGCGRPISQQADDERLLLDVRVNPFRGMEAQGGMMTITTREVRFQPHQMNLSLAELRIARNDISSVEPINTMGIVPNGIKIELRSGVAFKFVVTGRSRILALLT